MTDFSLTLRAAALAAEIQSQYPSPTARSQSVNRLVLTAYHGSQARLTSEAIAAAFLHQALISSGTWNHWALRDFPERVGYLLRSLQQGPPMPFAADPEVWPLLLFDRTEGLIERLNSPDAEPWAVTLYIEKTEADYLPGICHCRNSYIRERFLREWKRAAALARCPQRFVE